MTGSIRFVGFGRFGGFNRSLVSDAIHLDPGPRLYRLDDAFPIVVLESEDDVLRARLQREPVDGRS